MRPGRLAGELEVPLSTVNEWTRQLRFQRVLTSTPSGEFVDRPRLLQFYASTRVARLYPTATLRTRLRPSGLSQLLRRESIDHSLAMLAAANEWAFFEPRRRIELYVSRGDTRRVREVLPPGDNEVDVFWENPAELPIERRGPAVVTSAFLTIVDCRAHPEGGAHAHFLEQNVMGWSAD